MSDPITFVAPNIRGWQPYAFGTLAIAGFINESTGEDDSTENLLIAQEQGHIVASVTGFGQKTDVDAELIPAVNATIPKSGDIITIGSGPSAIQFEIHNLSKKRVQKGIMKLSVKGMYFPYVSFATT